MSVEGSARYFGLVEKIEWRLGCASWLLARHSGACVLCERSRPARSLDAKQVRVLRPRVIPPGDASRVIGEGRSIAVSLNAFDDAHVADYSPYCREQPARLGSRGSREQRSLSDTIEFDQYGRLIKASLINRVRKQSSVRRRHGGQDIHRSIRNASSPSRLARSSSWLLPTNPHDHVEIAITLMRAFGRLHLFDMGPENGVVRRQFADARLPPGIVQIVRVSRHPSPPQQGQLVGKRRRAARGSPPLTRFMTFPGVNPFGLRLALGDQLGAVSRTLDKMSL